MEWSRGPTIGRGSSATVSLAAASSSGDLFAVKSSRLLKSEPLQREQAILSTLSSPYLVAYKGYAISGEVSSDDRRTSELYYNLFMEYVPGGTLADVAGRVEELTIGMYTWRILMGLEYLHSLGVVHCDIKPRNILIGSEGPKIADLGCARVVSPAAPGMPPLPTQAAIAGTPMYMAPEVARGEQQESAADIWSLGCTVAELATGKPPWQSSSGDLVAAVYRIASSGETPEIPAWLSEEAKDFLGKCLSRNPHKRWTAGELLQHPFIKKYAAGDVDDRGTGIPTSKKRLFNSPTSTLDQGIWNSMEESSSSSSLSETLQEILDQRIRKLMTISGEPSWDSEENWITIRTG